MQKEKSGINLVTDKGEIWRLQNGFTGNELDVPRSLDHLNRLIRPIFALI